MNFKVNISICRVCMKPEPDQKSLLDDEELRSKFVFITRLTFAESDNMPAIMCYKCVARLKVAYDFVQLAHASEKNLKAFLTKISNDFHMFTSAGAESSVQDTEIDVLMLEVESPPATQQSSHVDDETPTRKPSDVANASNVAKPISTAPKPNTIKAEEQSQPTRGAFKQENQDNVNPNCSGKGEVVDEYMVFDNDDDLINERDDSEEKLEAYNENLSHNDELHIQEISDDADDIDSFHEDDAESQAELEMLEENLQQADESEDIQAISAQHDKDGYLKEYEAMLEENGNNYVDDEDDADENEDDGEHSMEELHLQELEQEEPEAVAMQSYVVVEDTETSSSVAAIMSVEKNESTSAGSSSNQTKPKTRTKPKATPSKTAMTQPGASKGNASKAKKHALNATNTRFYCMKCNRDFSTKTNLTRHMSTHEGFKPYECTDCGKKFTQNGSLKQHMYTHTGEKPYVCVVCDRGFTQCKSLVFHMRRHTGEKPFPCDQCGLSFRQKDGLKAHILKHHMMNADQEDGSELLNACIICKEQLADAPALQLHMKKHINNHRDISEGASGEVPQNDILLNLMDDDELLSEKAFISEELALDDDIEDASTHVVDLLATSATEPGRAKKFQCRQCFKCFAIKKNLVRHLSIHSVPVSEMFQCKTCEIAFDTNLALKWHRIREHKETGIILNQCDVCQSVFQTNTELNDHMRLTHDLNCPECAGLSFKSHKLLMEHMLEHEISELNENV